MMSTAKKGRGTGEELDRNDPSRDTKERLVKLLTKNPSISAREAAEKLGITRQRASQLAKDAGFKLQWTKVT